MTDQTPAQFVTAAGEAMYGEHWVAPLSEALGVNPRTLRRVREAARAGGAYPVAPGVLAALARLLRARAVELERMAAQVG